MASSEQESYGTRLGRRIAAARQKMAANQKVWREDRPSPLKPVLPEELSLNHYVLWQTYVLMAVTGLGYLALLWSTVVLLGGFVTALQKKDFWCLTAISMLQASRIFNDLEDHLSSNFVQLYLNAHSYGLGIIEAVNNKYHAKEHTVHTACRHRTILWGFILCFPVVGVILGLVFLVGFIYNYGHMVCVALSLWRIVQRDYGSDEGDGSKANLMPALDIFYSLVLCQGVLLFIWVIFNSGGMWPVVFLRRACRFPEKWGIISVSEYLFDTRAKCWRDPASIHGRKLINYAVDLLDSEKQQDYISGARMLDTFIKLDADVRSLILPSRPKIQKLIDTLGWRSSDREIRELAARIIAYLAGDIHLTQFPGAIRCISSLLDTTLPYWNNQQGHDHCSPQIKSNNPQNPKERLIFDVRRIEKQRAKRVEHRAKKVKNQDRDAHQDEVDSSTHDSKGDGWNELILQGMTILEKLASDQHNCIDICSTPGLLPKIIAPLHSETLIQDISINAWADVVNKSFKVVHKLIHVSEWTGRRLHSEISSSKYAVSNLEKILDEGNENVQELQMRAIEILTELALDAQTDLTRKIKENLIKKQLQIFLADDKHEEHATKFITERLKVTAGKTLALLCKAATMPALVTRGKDIAEIVDAKNKIIYRTIAAEILENLCSHRTIDKENVKNSLLPKVLKEVLTSQRKPTTEASQRNNSAPTGDAENQQLSAPREDEENQQLSAPRDDEENQQISVPGNDEENQQISAPRNDGEIQQLSTPGNDEENQLSGHTSYILNSFGQANDQQKAAMELKGEKELKEALLSLTLMICEKLIINEDEFDEAVRNIAPGEGEFVAKLKIIVEENCEATPNSLRIVKLCGQIAVRMIKRGQHMACFKDQKFVDALSKASRIMSNLESCMLFAGTDGGAKKTVRPLLSDIVKEAQAMVA